MYIKLPEEYWKRLPSAVRPASHAASASASNPAGTTSPEAYYPAALNLQTIPVIHQARPPQPTPHAPRAEMN